MTSADAPRSRAAAAARWTLFAVLLLGFILVPFFVLEDPMNEWVQRTLRSTTSVVLITLAVVGFLLADIALPIPSSFVLTTTGYLLGLPLGAMVGFIGLSAAALAGYALGRFAGAPLAERIVGHAQMDRFARLSARHGDLLLVAFRAMPVLAEATTLLAGMAPMPLPRFLLLASIGNAVVAGVYAWIGAFSAGQSSFLVASIAAIVLPALVVLALRRTLHQPAAH